MKGVEGTFNNPKARGFSPRRLLDRFIGSMGPSQGAGTNLLGNVRQNIPVADWGGLLGAQIVPREARGYPDIKVTVQIKKQKLFCSEK